MKNQRQNRNSGKNGGFTLLEVVVTVVVFGILCAATTVSWSSFMRYQELREDATAFHKELLAMKARALDTGDTVTIAPAPDSSGYIITWSVPNEDDDNSTEHTKTVTFNKNVTITAPTTTTANDDLPQLSPNGSGGVNNAWAAEGIVIAPDNLNAFKGSGRVMIKNSSKKFFCIQKDDSNIKPIMYYKSGDNGKWKKI